MSKTKSFPISQTTVVEAYKRVKARKGAGGVDQVDFEEFDKDLKSNLYKIWNRLSAGTYFPPPVKAVPIPKKKRRNPNLRNPDNRRSNCPDGCQTQL